MLLWRAELVQFDSDYHRIGVFAEESIPANGSWRLENVPTGFFSLSLSSDNGDRWFSHSLETGPETGPVFLTIPIVEVQGTVRLGSEPLPARLVFGGKYGSQSIYLAADEEGEFSGLLPRPGTWNTVPVSHASGTLVLELPESLDLSRWDAQRPIIFHGGGVVSVYALRSWAAFHGQMPESESRFVVPNVEPGRYAACLAPLDAFRPLLAGINPGVPCVAGDLAVSGELTLSLRDASL